MMPNTKLQKQQYIQKISHCVMVAEVKLAAINMLLISVSCLPYVPHIYLSRSHFVL